MNKNIQTHNADYKLTQKFLDYANCADASYTSLKYALYFIFGILAIILFNGCSFSFKYIDPQYYKFKRLCKYIDSAVEVYNQDYWEMDSDYVEKRFKNSKIDESGREYFYYEKLNVKVYPYSIREVLRTEQKNGNITIQVFDEYYKNIHYASYTRYNYNGKSLKLQGDEAAGWYWETEDKHTCSYLDNFYKERGR